MNRRRRVLRWAFFLSILATMASVLVNGGLPEWAQLAFLGLLAWFYLEATSAAWRTVSFGGVKVKECPGCGELIDAGEMACSGACMRIHRFAELAAGRPDPMSTDL